MSCYWPLVKAAYKILFAASSLKPQNRNCSEGSRESGIIHRGDKCNAIERADDQEQDEGRLEQEEGKLPAPAYLSFGKDSRHKHSRSTKKRTKKKDALSGTRIDEDNNNDKEEPQSSSIVSVTSSLELSTIHTSTEMVSAHVTSGEDDSGCKLDLQNAETRSSNKKKSVGRRRNKAKRNDAKLTVITSKRSNNHRSTRKEGRKTRFVSNPKRNDGFDEELCYICESLGMDPHKFCCLRHPDQNITCLCHWYEPIYMCRICDSENQANHELLPQQQKNVEVVIEHVQEMQADEARWKERTDIVNWGSDCDADLDSFVKHVVTQDIGKDDMISEKEWMSQVLQRVLQVRAWKSLDRPALRSDPDYARYFRLLQIGVPLDAIKFTVVKDGLDPFVMDLNPDLPLKTQQSERNIKPTSASSISLSSTGDSEVNLITREFRPVPEIALNIHIAFNRMRSKELLSASKGNVKDQKKFQRNKGNGSRPEKKRYPRMRNNESIHSNTQSSRDKKTRSKKYRNCPLPDATHLKPETQQAGSENVKAGQVDAIDEKDLLIQTLKEELEMKELEIVSLHEKVQVMELKIISVHSSHRSFGSYCTAPSLSSHSDRSLSKSEEHNNPNGTRDRLEMYCGEHSGHNVIRQEKEAFLTEPFIPGSDALHRVETFGKSHDELNNDDNESFGRQSSVDSTCTDCLPTGVSSQIRTKQGRRIVSDNNTLSDLATYGHDHAFRQNSTNGAQDIHSEDSTADGEKDTAMRNETGNEEERNDSLSDGLTLYAPEGRDCFVNRQGNETASNATTESEVNQIEIGSSQIKVETSKLDEYVRSGDREECFVSLDEQSPESSFKVVAVAMEHNCPSRGAKPIENDDQVSGQSSFCEVERIDDKTLGLAHRRASDGEDPSESTDPKNDIFDHSADSFSVLSDTEGLGPKSAKMKAESDLELEKMGDGDDIVPIAGHSGVMDTKDVHYVHEDAAMHLMPPNNNLPSPCDAIVSPQSGRNYNYSNEESSRPAMPSDVSSYEDDHYNFSPSYEECLGGLTNDNSPEESEGSNHRAYLPSLADPEPKDEDNVVTGYDVRERIETGFSGDGGGTSNSNDYLLTNGTEFRHDPTDSSTQEDGRGKDLFNSRMKNVSTSNVPHEFASPVDRTAAISIIGQDEASNAEVLEISESTSSFDTENSFSIDLPPSGLLNDERDSDEELMMAAALVAREEIASVEEQQRTKPFGKSVLASDGLNGHFSDLFDDGYTTTQGESSRFSNLPNDAVGGDYEETSSYENDSSSSYESYESDDSA